jgi:predicted MFS family arabinose efflux permease
MSRKRRAWSVLLAAFFASIAVAINQFKVPPVMQTLMADLGLDMVTGGWTMSAFSVAGLILAVPAAILLGRWGIKLAGLLAMGCTITGAVAGALAPNAAVLIGSRVVEGAGAGLIAIVAPAAISAWFAPRDRGIPMGVWATWVPVGSVIMFNAAHPLVASFGWRSVWWFGALLAAATAVLWAFVVADPPADAAAEVPSPVAPAPLGRMLLNADSWLLALAFGTFAFSLLSYNTWAPAYLVDTMGMAPAQASLAASMVFLAGIPGNLFAGWILNRTRHRYRVLVLGFLVAGILFIPGFRLGSAAIVIPYMLVLGFVANIIPTTGFTLAPETMPAPSLAGLALAILSIGSGLGILVGPPSVGAVISARGWTAAGVLLVLVMGAGLATAVIAWRRARGNEE